MKKLLVAVAGLVAGFIAIVAVAVVDYQFTWPPTFPATPRPSLRASADPAVIARGEYLFHVAAHCTHCHSPMAEHWGKAVGLRVAPRDGTEIPLESTRFVLEGKELEFYVKRMARKKK